MVRKTRKATESCHSEDGEGRERGNVKCWS